MGSRPAIGLRPTVKAESAARERGGPVEPAPGNAGEGNEASLRFPSPGSVV